MIHRHDPSVPIINEDALVKIQSEPLDSRWLALIDNKDSNMMSPVGFVPNIEETPGTFTKIWCPLLWKLR